MYLMSPGQPAEIGLQLGKGLLSLQQVKVEGEYFSGSSLSFIFLFLPCPSRSSPLLSLFFLWETTQNEPQELRCH